MQKCYLNLKILFTSNYRLALLGLKNNQKSILNLLNLLKFIASRAVHCISLTLMIRVHAYAVSAPLKLSSDGAWTVLLSSLFQSACVLTKNEFLYISVLAKGILI